MFYLLCVSLCAFPFVFLLSCVSFSNSFLYYTIFHLQAFLPIYSLSCPFSSHLASFTSTLSSFPFLIFLSHLLFLLSVSPFLFSYSFFLSRSSFPFSQPTLILSFLSSIFSLIHSLSLSSSLTYLCLPLSVIHIRAILKACNSTKIFNSRFIIYAQEESAEAKKMWINRIMRRQGKDKKTTTIC